MVLTAEEIQSTVTDHLENGTPLPEGWGAYSYSIYRRSFVADTADMLKFIDNALRERGDSIRIIGIESEEFDETHGQVTFQLVMDGKEI